MLKKCLILLGIGFLVLLPKLASAEEIVSFDVKAIIQPDASVRVTETIQYDFGAEEKHGIFRIIPYKYYAAEGSRVISLKDFSVTDEKGNNLKFLKLKEATDISLKIGDADKTITGIHTYIISYTVKNALLFFEESDELYWNATGNGWEVPIKNASVRVEFTSPVDSSQIGAACYVGVAGEDTSCAQKQVEPSIYFAQTDLGPGQGLTFAVGFPKGTVKEPSQWAKKLLIILDKAVRFLPAVVLLVLILVWTKYGKDPVGRGTIVAQFDAPENLTPLEVGALVDERVDQKDISAEIINLAVRGYLKINHIEKDGLIFKDKDYEFEQLKPAVTLATEHEKTIMSALFGVKPEQKKAEKVLLSHLQYNSEAYEEMKKLGPMIDKDLVKSGYFKFNPSTVRMLYFLGGIVFIVIGIFFTSFFINKAWAALSLFVSGLMISFSARFMPSRTARGVSAWEHILGLKKYLQVAEKDRLEFHNAPEKKPEVFEKLLPFAMALGVEKEWAKQFESLYTSPPTWYQTTAGQGFSAMVLADDFGRFRSSVHKTLGYNHSSASGSGSAAFGSRGSGGGGFSGGGFGGGGGRSW